MVIKTTTGSRTAPDLVTGHAGISSPEDVGHAQFMTRPEGIMDRYRVDYGNGQVWYPGPLSSRLLAQCRAHIAAMDLYRDYASVEHLDIQTGDWVRVPR